VPGVSWRGLRVWKLDLSEYIGCDMLSLPSSVNYFSVF
jgi:hypothetical protein